MKDGVLASTDGDLMYLQARVKRGASVTLDEDTSVKKTDQGRALFVGSPARGRPEDREELPNGTIQSD